METTGKKYHLLWSLMAILLIGAVFGSCSKSEERIVPTYLLKITNVSDSLNKNSNAIYQLNQLKISQYDTDNPYMQTDEADALQRFQKTISIIQNYDWSKYNLASGSSFTLQLITYEGDVVSEQSIILKR